jgi:hypothetical protein
MACLLQTPVGAASAAFRIKNFLVVRHEDKNRKTKTDPFLPFRQDWASTPCPLRQLQHPKAFAFRHLPSGATLAPAGKALPRHQCVAPACRPESDCIRKSSLCDFLRFCFSALATYCACSNPLFGLTRCSICRPSLGPYPVCGSCAGLSGKLPGHSPKARPGLTCDRIRLSIWTESSRSGAIIQALFSQSRMCRKHSQAPDL